MSHHNFTSSYKFFDDLTAHELYAIMRLRSEVFVLEQQCIYQDADNKDLSAYHLMIQNGGTLIAYARLLPPGISYEYMSIGRVICKQDYRRKGAGRLLMKEAIKACRELFGEGPIRIGAQLYLKKFYESFEFVQTGEVYLEDDIEHMEMTRQ